jgi:hypothetical protein
MGADEMTNRIADGSPRLKARMAGACQLLEAIAATFGQVIVLNKLVVSGNAAATAANILGHERLFWMGFASSLMGVVVTKKQVGARVTAQGLLSKHNVDSRKQ